MEKSNSLIRTILDLYRKSLAYISPKAAEYGIGRGQWYFFNRLLLEHDGISQEQLSEELYVDKAHTARAIKKLEEDGFVRRMPDEEDGRKKNVYITEKSVALKDDYQKIYKELNQVLIKGFTSEEADLAYSFLDRMRENINLYMKKQDQAV